MCSIARDAELGRDVALKRMRRKHAASASARERFLLEARVTGRLEHPGIVPVYGVGIDEAGQPYYAMRFVQGETLHDAIKRHHRDKGGPSLRQLLTAFVAVCNTVAYAHSKGVLHRDLKPANVMLGPYGETLILDWGLARVERSATPGVDDSPNLTQAGTVQGTPQFMSPEQAEGRGDLAPPSDVYSLGATLYALLTGEPPIEGKTTPEVLDRVRRGDFRRPRQRSADVPRRRTTSRRR